MIFFTFSGGDDLPQPTMSSAATPSREPRGWCHPIALPCAATCRAWLIDTSLFRIMYTFGMSLSVMSCHFLSFSTLFSTFEFSYASRTTSMLVQPNYDCFTRSALPTVWSHYDSVHHTFTRLPPVILLSSLQTSVSIQCR